MITFYTKQRTIEEKVPFKVKSDLKELFSLLENAKEVELDTETNHSKFLKGKIIMVQFGLGKDQHVIDARDFDITPLNEVLKDTLVYGQNFSFDYKFFRSQGIYIEKIWDCMIAENVINQGRSINASLDSLAKRYLNIDLPKNEQKSFLGMKDEPFTLNQIVYGANDVNVMKRIAEKQERLAKKLNVFKAVELENKFVPVLADTEYNGIYIDKEEWLKNAQEREKDLLEQEKELDRFIISCKVAPDDRFFSYKRKKNKRQIVPFYPDIFGSQPERFTDINWRSPKKKIDILKKFGFSFTNRDTGGKTSNIKYLESAEKAYKRGDYSDFKEPEVEIEIYTQAELLEKLIEYGHTSKEVSTYGESFIDNYYEPSTGRVYTGYWQIGTETGRLSSGTKDDKNKKTEYWNPLCNLQNQPQTYRRFYEVPEHRKYIGADYPSQESRVLADFSKDKKLVDFYLNGGADLHSYVCQMVFPYTSGIPLDEVKQKYKKERQICKAVNFAIAYGGNEITIANNANIPIEQASKVYNEYLKTFSGLKRYFDAVIWSALNHGYIQVNNVSHRKIWLEDHKQYLELKDFGYHNLSRREYSVMKKLEGKMSRAALNYPIQGTSAEMTKLAGIYMRKEFIQQGWYSPYSDKEPIVRLNQMTHDEWGADAPNEYAEAVGKIMAQSMERAGKMFCKIIPLPVEPEIGQFWPK